MDQPIVWILLAFSLLTAACLYTIPLLYAREEGAKRERERLGLLYHTNPSAAQAELHQAAAQALRRDIQKAERSTARLIAKFPKTLRKPLRKQCLPEPATASV